jgi:hypothetical protein
MFNSFIQGGFECSTQRLGSGRRLDLVESTGHQRYLTSDYLNLSQLGIATVREGARWNSIRRTNGSFDWSSLLPFLTAARRGNIEIIWDLVHFGWPDELDIFSDKWIEEFSEYAFAFASLLRTEGAAAPLLIPVNEVSFLSWAAGEVGYLNPFKAVRYREMIYTGPIDEFFDYRFGKLPYRSLRFQHETLDTARLQPVAVINYPNDRSYTRVTEFKHLTGQKHSRTRVVYEYPSADSDPYYPVPRPENAELYARYQLLTKELENIHFTGRLATYRYYNMDQVVGQSLALCANLSGKRRRDLTTHALAPIPAAQLPAEDAA